MAGHPVNWYSDVFELVFPNVNAEQANNIWKEQLAKPAAKDSKSDADEV